VLIRLSLWRRNEHHSSSTRFCDFVRDLPPAPTVRLATVVLRFLLLLLLLLVCCCCCCAAAAVLLLLCCCCCCCSME